MSNNHDRDYSIVTDILNGMSYPGAAKKYNLSSSRTGQIFSKFTRLLRGYNGREGKGRLERIFSQEKYPHAWRSERGELFFSGHDIRLHDWRSEKEHVFAYLDEITKKDQT